MAQAIVYSSFGEPSVLELITVPDPQPGVGQVVVRIAAAGVNPIDAKLRSGIRPSAEITRPRHVGFDGAGIVIAAGPEALGFGVGDRVAIGWAAGTYATEVAVDASKCAHLPANVSFAAGAGVGIPAATAYQALLSLGVSAGDTVLIHGGSGVVGQFAVQFARNSGANVIATAGSKSHDRLRELGATPVRYGPGLLDRVREAAPEGVDAALDCAGTDEALQVSLDVVSDRDRIATIVRGADAEELGIRAFQGGSARPLTAQESAWRHEALAKTLALMASDQFSIPLADPLPLAEAYRAHQIVETGHAGGKIVLIPAGQNPAG